MNKMNTVETITKVFHETKVNFKGLASKTIPYVIVSSFLLLLIETLMKSDGFFTVALVSTLYYILLSIIQLVGLSYLFNISGESLTIDKSKILKYVFASCYLSMATALGFLLFVIPGLFIQIISFFYPIHILKDNAGPFEAFDKSIDLVKGNLEDFFKIYILFSVCIKAIEYIYEHIMSIFAIPDLIDLLLLHTFSYLISLIYIPLMFVVYRELIGES